MTQFQKYRNHKSELFLGSETEELLERFQSGWLLRSTHRSLTDDVIEECGDAPCYYHEESTFYYTDIYQIHADTVSESDDHRNIDTWKVL